MLPSGLDPGMIFVFAIILGALALFADGIVAIAASLPPIGVLGLIYVVTALLTNVVSNNASVVLMLPVAAEAAVTLGPTPSRSCCR